LKGENGECFHLQSNHLFLISIYRSFSFETPSENTRDWMVERLRSLVFFSLADSTRVARGKYTSSSSMSFGDIAMVSTCVNLLHRGIEVKTFPTASSCSKCHLYFNPSLTTLILGRNKAMPSSSDQELKLKDISELRPGISSFVFSHVEEGNKELRKEDEDCLISIIGSYGTMGFKVLFFFQNYSFLNFYLSLIFFITNFL